MPSGAARRKQKPDSPSDPLAAVSMVRARDILGELVDRALYEGKSSVILRRGREAAAVVPMALYRKLVKVA